AYNRASRTVIAVPVLRGSHRKRPPTITSGLPTVPGPSHAENWLSLNPCCANAYRLVFWLAIRRTAAHCTKTSLTDSRYSPHEAPSSCSPTPPRLGLLTSGRVHENALSVRGELFPRCAP